MNGLELELATTDDIIQELVKRNLKFCFILPVITEKTEESTSGNLSMVSSKMDLQEIEAVFRITLQALGNQG